jgi:hypothetical protein
MSTSPRFATIPGKTGDVLENVSPVKLMGPFPVATTLDPTCFSVTVKAWAGPTEKSDVTAIPKSVSGRSFLGTAFMPKKSSIKDATVR